MKYRKQFICVIVAILVGLASFGCFASDQPVGGTEPSYQTPSTSYQPQDSSTEERQTEPPRATAPAEHDVTTKPADSAYNEHSTEREYVETPETTAFTAIAYYPSQKILWVTFRNSGVSYVYYDVPREVWQEFKTADSKGGYFNDYIKGVYEYDRE